MKFIIAYTPKIALIKLISCESGLAIQIHVQWDAFLNIRKKTLI